jgi:hypothetical protein
MRLVKPDCRPLVFVRLFSSATSAVDIHVYASAVRLAKRDYRMTFKPELLERYTGILVEDYGYD